jgi:surfeit locus 1 family protein
MTQGFGFRPRLLSTLAAATAILATFWLGNWQLDRAQEKARLQQRMEQGARAPIHLGAAKVDPADLVYYPVEARGAFDVKGTVYLDNRVHAGVPGYEVVTPLRLDGGRMHVLVIRGWVSGGATRDRLPEVTTPAGQVQVEGVAVPGDPALFELSREVRSGRLWQNVTVERYAEAFGLELQPIMIRERNDLGDRLLREWKRPDAGIDRHRAYALQWFSLGVGVAVLYAVLNVRRRTTHRSQSA